MARRTAHTSHTVTRNIFFFVPRSDDAAANYVDISRFLKELRLKSDDERLLEESEERATRSWIDAAAEPYRFRMAIIRRSGFPLLDTRGCLTPIQAAVDAGLAEVTHFLYTKDGLLAVEYNHFGPRPSRVAHYIHSMFPEDCPAFSFDPVVRSDALAQLQRMSGLKVAEFRVPSEVLAAVPKPNALLTQLHEMADATGSTTLQLTLRVARTGTLAEDTVKEASRSLAKEAAREGAPAAIRVKGFDPEMNRLDVVDLLNGRLYSVQEIARASETSGALDDGSAYSALSTAYEERRDDLVRLAYGAADK